MSKTAIEKVAKEVEMQRIISALETANIAVDRVNDFGTLAYMVNEGALEGRFITLKVVLTKEYAEDADKGFDMQEAISEYELKVKIRAEAEKNKKS